MTYELVFSTKGGDKAVSTTRSLRREVEALARAGQQVAGRSVGFAGPRGTSGTRAAAAIASRHALAQRMAVAMGGGSGTGGGVRRVGQILGSAGGQVLNRVGGILGAPTPGMAAGGAAAAALFVGYNAMAAASDRAANRAETAARSLAQLGESIQAAVDAADDAARGALTRNRAAIGVLAGLGGEDAIAQAKAFARHHGEGAITGAAAMAKAGLGTRGMHVADVTARTGLMDFDSAAGLLAQNRHLAFGAGGLDAISARLLTKGGFRGMTAQGVAEMRARFRSSDTALAGFELQGAEGRTAMAALDRGGTGAAALGVGGLFDSANQSRAAIVDPEGAARAAHATGVEQQLAIIAKGSQAEWAMVALLRDLGAALGLSQESRVSQSRDLHAALRATEP